MNPRSFIRIFLSAVLLAPISAKLLEAAERGVRVRFLLDDIFTTIQDVDLFVLNEHENIEVRLFNPPALIVEQFNVDRLQTSAL